MKILKLKEEYKMAKSIVGVYNTLEETVRAIDDLRNRGYPTSQISVITNRDDSNYLDDWTAASVEQPENTMNTSNTNSHSESMWEKIKDFFSMDHHNPKGRLTNMDLPENELNTYQNDLEEGKYLLALDKDPGVNDLNDEVRTGDYMADDRLSNDGVRDTNYAINNALENRNRY
jgi:hypothetical protein